MSIGAFRGATSFEVYIGRAWIRVPYWQYVIAGVWPSVGWDTRPDQSINYMDKCKRRRTDGPTPCWCCPGECIGETACPAEACDNPLTCKMQPECSRRAMSGTDIEAHDSFNPQPRVRPF